MSMDDGAWFLTMTLYGCVGLALLLFCFSQCRERVVMDSSETETSASLTSGWSLSTTVRFASSPSSS